MKRFFLLLTLSLLSILSTAAGASAERQPAGPADQPAAVQPAPPSSPAAGADPLFLTECTIFRNCVCASGGTFPIECSGTVCMQGPGRAVTCDGVTTTCPPIGSC